MPISPYSCHKKGQMYTAVLCIIVLSLAIHNLFHLLHSLFHNGLQVHAAATQPKANAATRVHIFLNLAGMEAI